MSDEDPLGFVDKTVRRCFSLFLAAIALYLAVTLIKSILPTLLLIGGIVGAMWLGIVVFRTWKERW
ncbi:hypothetical protein ACIBCN_19285 [Nocardia sp. NPDC051052]|uniref:hypothetical protein n=1 Tax=Nocardia sp. NPDC051052 TaxID=3364322 RepID=UPI0037BCC63A